MKHLHAALSNLTRPWYLITVISKNTLEYTSRLNLL